MVNHLLMWEHPQTLPDGDRPLPYIIDPPSMFSPSSRFVRFREMLLRIIPARPDDADLPDFLKCVDRVLEWRTTIPLQDRFWRRDQVMMMSSVTLRNIRKS